MRYWSWSAVVFMPIITWYCRASRASSARRSLISRVCSPGATYTYKVAIASGKGSDYALASAFTIIIFFVVALISGVAFYRTKSLETMA